MRADELERALATLIGPTIVCAQAGNVNTGAVDPLREWAEQNLKEVLNAQRRYDAARKDIAA